MKRLILLCTSAWLISSCHAQTSSSQHSQATDTITTLMLPAIPAALTTPEQRAEYLVAHYWDLVNLADTNYIHHPEVTEQGWVNFIDLLKLVPASQADAALAGIVQKATCQKKCLQHLMQLAEKYLYDPASPMRNDTYYLSVLKTYLSLPTLSDTEKLRFEDIQRRVLLNRVGTKAQNFRFTLASGAEQELDELQAPYTLLFFHNPDCHACGEAMDQLRHSPTLNRAIEAGTLVILSIYPDEEVAVWKSWIDHYPTNWLNAYDKKQVIQEKNLYDLLSIPSLYLLNADKTVILKDVTAETVENWWQEHIRP